MPRIVAVPCSIFLLLLLFAPTQSFSASVEQQREGFLQAEQAIKHGQSAEALALMETLKDYPLYPYLLFQKLMLELDNAPPIEDYLNRYGQYREAILLRQRWLENLAKQGSWAAYAKHYRETDNINLQCHYYLSLSKLGREKEALAGAEKLWLTGTSLPESCDSLFALWRTSPQYTPDHAWKRFALAMQAENIALADRLSALLPETMARQAVLWKQVHDNPRLILSCSSLNPQETTSGQMFAYGIDRLAADDPLSAQTAWLLHKGRFSIDAGEATRLDRRTALALAGQRLDQAGAYLQDVPNSNADQQIRGWRVRSALSRQDWMGVLAAIDLLSAEEKKQAQWLYWKGRALESLGDGAGARESYQLAAKEKDYFGFNAADRVGLDYAITSKPRLVAEDELNRLADTPPFPAIRELLILNREAWARGEWFHAIKLLPPSELLTAAKLAQRWGQDNLAINTAIKAGVGDDLSLRFPLGSKPIVLEAAQSYVADPSMIYAMVRRESAFDPNAGSTAGAKGLMQLVPSTGELMARHLGENFPSANSLLEPERNLRYGIAYFKELMEKFRNHFALAAAAYNAGPNRVERWLPNDHSMSADIWVETMPINETRQYVAAVLSYAVIYQVQLGQPLRRISEFLPVVPIGSKSAAKPERSVSVPVCD